MKKLFTNLSGGILVVLLFIGNVFAQNNITVKGNVTDATDGEPLIGVSIKIKGSTQGTSTDVNGAFSISAPSNGTLVFTYIGFQTLEIPVNNQTSITARLQASAEALDEVVVVGYGTQRKRDLTGSITQVKGEDIARSPNINPVSSLQGRVAGLTIVNSGSPGGSPTVRIRGINSTNYSNPLYVVDGVFQENIDYLNPADIESIEVLKDPSSIAIFGSQGGNGVIVVTTKRAERGKTTVSLQSSTGLQHVNNRIDVVDAEGFKRLYSAQLANLGSAPFDFTNYTANTDWQDLILRTAIMSNNSLSISNSGEKTTTLINLGYNTQEGVLKYSNHQRFIARLNQEVRINDNIKVGGDLNGFHWISNGSPVSLNNALWAAPIVGVQEDENTYYSMPSFQRSQVGNPVATLNRGNKTAINKGYRVVGNLFAEVTFLKQFRWRSAVYADLGFNNSRGYTPLPFTFINLGEGTTPTSTSYDENVRTGVSQNQSENRRFQQDHTITYDTTFNNVHRLTAVAGFTTMYSGGSNISGNRTDTRLNIPNDPDYWYLGISQQSNPGNFNGGGGENSNMGFLARVNYSYAGKYLLNASFRRDGSSKFAPENRWGNFGSIGAGWVASEEEFLKDKLGGIEFLKLRGAWGTVGNALGFGDNLYRPGLSTANVGVFGENVYPSVQPAYIPDPNLHWEVVRGLDLGVDVRAFRDRLSAEFTYYDRKTKDIITSVTLPNETRAYRTNLGEISNKGVEVSLGWNDRIGDDFTYRISPNFSYNKNNVESIGSDFNFQLLGNGGVNRTVSGESIGYFWGYRQIGIYQSSADLERIPALSSSLPGDIAFEDTDGDGVITPNDRVNLGTPFPKWNYGLNISLQYKGFDAIIEGQGVAGNHIYTQRRNVQFAPVNYESNRLNAWTGPGTSNVEPILDISRGNNYLFSSYFLEPGDYFRLRTLQLGYTFSPVSLKKIGLSQLRLYISGQNIATFSKTTGYSPEVPISDILGGGADNGVYPVPATYTFGFNVTF